MKVAEVAPPTNARCGYGERLCGFDQRRCCAAACKDTSCAAPLAGAAARGREHLRFHRCVRFVRTGRPLSGLPHVGPPGGAEWRSARGAS
eukprot:6281-Chlamydomonas_euryale.AAC.7